MDKKIAGLLIFTIFFGLLMGYPTVLEYVNDVILKNKVQTAMRTGNLNQVYELLSDREIHGYGWDFLALVEAKDHVGMSIEEELNRLKRDKEIEMMQYIIDTLGESAYRYIEIFATVDGLVLSEGLRYEMAKNTLIDISIHDPSYARVLDKAMLIRGERDIVDDIEVRFLAHNGELEKALEMYKELDEYYKEELEDVLIHYLFEGITHGLRISVGVGENVKKLEAMDLPDEILKAIIKREILQQFSYSHAPQSPIHDYSLFTDTIYYKYYKTLSGLVGNYDITDATISTVLNELKSNEDFKIIRDSDELFNTLENFKRVSAFEYIGKNGHLLYRDSNGRTVVYNTGSRETRELEIPRGGIALYSFSTGREYYLAAGILYRPENDTYIPEITDIIFDSSFQVVRKSATTSSMQYDDEGWLSQLSLYGFQLDFYENTFDRFTYITSPRIRENPYIIGFNIHDKTDYHLYSVGEGTYAALNYNTDQQTSEIVYKNYSEHCKDTGIILYQFDLTKELGFLGACDENVYVARMIDDVLLVIESVNKTTSERTVLPFYSLNRLNMHRIYHDLWFG